MLNRSEIEYLKKVNGVRKKLGLALDTDQCKRKSFLIAVSEIKNQHSEI
jgi:hypothetical protein